MLLSEKSPKRSDCVERGNSAERLAGVDIIKTLGLLLVIYYHIVWQYTPDIVTSTSPANYLIVYLETFLAICVPLFFMASGALSLSRPVNLKKNTLRAVHLLIITLCWVVICLGVILLLRHQRVSLREFISIGENLQVGYIQHLWYLPCFIFLTLMLPVLSALKTANRKIYRYFILLIAVFSFGVPLLNHGEYLLRLLLGKTGYTGYRYFFWKVDFFKYHYWYAFVYFALGGFLVERKKKQRFIWLGIPLGMTGLFLIALSSARVRGSAYDFVFNNYNSIFTLLVAVAVFALLIHTKPHMLLRRVTASVAKCSLGIYVVHWLVWEAFVQLMPEIMKSLAWGIPMTFVIGGISWGITWLGLRIPMVKNLFTAAPAWVGKYSRIT